MAKHWEFTVTGQSIFPLDMLRYDACYPVNGNAVGEIAASFITTERLARRNAKKDFKVRLKTWIAPPTTDRWNSFHWSIEDIKKV